MKKLNTSPKTALLLFESPLSAGIMAFFVYALFAMQAGPIWQSSPFAYFNYLADAFLHGQFHLRLIPPQTHDLALYNGNYYLYWPPFPAVLLMPFIALFGVQFSDILFTLVLAAVNVGLVAYFLRQLSDNGLAPTEPWHRILLTVFFAFGTVHFVLAKWGQVWFTSQIVAFTCGLLVYVIVLRYEGAKAFFLSGLALSLAMLTRSHLLLLGIWPAFYLFHQHKGFGWKKVAKHFVLFLIPIITALIFYAYYNQLRFGNFMDLGIGTSHRNLGAFFQADFEKYGHFNLRYFPKNFYYNFIYYPFPPSDETTMGGSMFLLSPVFFAAFFGFSKKQVRFNNLLLVTTIIATLLPILLNIGTGWATFGPRYTLDFYPPLLILTAVGITRFSKRVLIFLTAVSVTHYMIGALLVRFY